MHSLDRKPLSRPFKSRRKRRSESFLSLFNINDERSGLNFRSCKEKGDIGRYRLRVMIETFDAAQLATAKSGTGSSFSELVNGSPRNSCYGTGSRMDPEYLLLGLNF